MVTSISHRDSTLTTFGRIYYIYCQRKQSLLLAFIDQTSSKDHGHRSKVYLALAKEKSINNKRVSVLGSQRKIY
jgi:hypothetical protein